MAEEPDGGPPIALLPATWARHDGAVRYVEGLIRTRAPLPGTSRFPGLAPGAWAILDSGDVITGATGTRLGTGTVTLCDQDAFVLDDSPVNVYNAGPEITAVYGDKIVRLAWTGGEWAVNCASSDLAGDGYYY